MTAIAFTEPPKVDAERARPIGVAGRAAAYAQELVVIATVFILYRQVRFMSQDAGESAFANADRVLRWESTVFSLSERGVQQVVLRSEMFVEFLNRYYVSVHFPLTVLFVLWLLFRHPGSYRRVRNWLISTTVIALVVHVAFPLAPPRMLPGFVDTLRVYGPNIYPADTSASMANQFAAMPSLHFGWSLIVAAGFMMTVRRRWSAVALLHPLVTLIAIVATANHYFLDAAAAAVIVLVAAGISMRTKARHDRSLRALLSRAARHGAQGRDHVRTDRLPASTSLDSNDSNAEPAAARPGIGITNRLHVHRSPRRRSVRHTFCHVPPEPAAATVGDTAVDVGDLARR